MMKVGYGVMRDFIHQNITKIGRIGNTFLIDDELDYSERKCNRGKIELQKI